MSAPDDTNVEKQADKHRPALLGMGGVVAFAAVLLVGLIVYLTAMGNTPGGENDGITPDKAPMGTDIEETGLVDDQG